MTLIETFEPRDGHDRRLALGATGVLRDLNQAGIRFRDLHTTQSSLEDIFVNTLRADK